MAHMPPLAANAIAMFKTKILILGPVQSGKSTIANYLADATELTGGDYRPTQGVRIVEFESNDLELNGRNIDAEVELWDCSGDTNKTKLVLRFESCWPAIQRDAHGVILVCNTDNAAHADALQHWYTSFVVRRGIKPQRVLVFKHRKPTPDGQLPTADDGLLVLPHSLAQLQSVVTSIEEDGDQLRLEFNNFLCNVISGLATSQ